jgi:hypothetical protein
VSIATDRNSIQQDREWKAVELAPQRTAWATMIAGAIVPLGMAVAAVVATRFADSERVAVTAWIAVAVVGTASVIAAATAARRRTVERAGIEERERELDRDIQPRPTS